MVMNIKPIETAYNGYRFRSRLEARWAVFWDTLGVKYQYEPEGFVLGQSKQYLYLPDFWLETVDMWAEVKPGPLVGDDLIKAELLVLESGFSLVVLAGTPEWHPYDVIERCSNHDCEMWCSEQGKWIQRFRDGPHKPHIRWTDALLSSEYIFGERRFFWAPGGDEEGYPRDHEAVAAARSARFEHGEHGR